MHTRLRTIVMVGILVGGGVMLGSCQTSGKSGAAHGRLQVVAAENFWGSIVTQLAGDRADVRSIISDPAADPHDYEATPQDARLVAQAQYVVVNGIGYDAWAQKLVNGGGVSGRRVLDVGKLIGATVGGNPHQWYAPGTVDRFVARVATDLAALDPDDARYFEQRRAAFTTKGLAPYHDLIAEIRRQDSGTPVGASESIMAPMVSALGLDMKTPSSFLDAVAEGNEPTARDTARVTRQIDEREIDVFVYNSQNATPDVKRLVEAARAHDIPVTTVTETLSPAGATFQAWQVSQLRALRDALDTART